MVEIKSLRSARSRAIDKDPKSTLQVSSSRGFASELGLPLRAHLKVNCRRHQKLKIKNPGAPAVRREAEEDWSGKRMTRGGRSRPGIPTVGS